MHGLIADFIHYLDVERGLAQQRRSAISRI